MIEKLGKGYSEIKAGAYLTLPFLDLFCFRILPLPFLLLRTLLLRTLLLRSPLPFVPPFSGFLEKHAPQ
jgi:hypothetical protein